MALALPLAGWAEAQLEAIRAMAGTPALAGLSGAQLLGERAALNGFAAVIAHKSGVEVSILRVETFLGVFIGAVTFTGSVIAYGKLAGKVDGKAKKLPGGHVLNAAAAAMPPPMPAASSGPAM